MSANHLATWSIEVEWRNRQLPQKEKKQFCIYLDCSSKVNVFILVNALGVSTTCWRRSAGAEERRGRHPSREALGSAMLSLHFSAQSRSLKNVNQAAAFLILIWRHCATFAPQQPPYMYFRLLCGGWKRTVQDAVSSLFLVVPMKTLASTDLWFDKHSCSSLVVMCLFFWLVHLYCCSLCCHNIIIIVGDSS